MSKEKNSLSKNPIITVSHHIRNPVYVLKSYLQALSSGDAGEISEKQRLYLSACLRNADKVSDTLEKLVMVVEAEGKLYDLKNEDLDIVDLTKKVIDKNKELLLATSTNVSLVSSEEKIIIRGDEEKLEQALGIFLFNAVKYKRAGEAEVEITIKKEGESMILSVADTGIGFLEEEAEKIFTKFYRSEKAMKTDPGGIGVDLYITKIIIEAMRGSVWAQQRNSREGSVFFIKMGCVY